MEGADIISRLAYGSLEIIAHQSLGLGKLCFRDLQRIGATAINLGSDGTQCLVATLAYTLEDGTHAALNNTIIICSTLHQCGPR